jgi:hypothetical protein
MSRTADYTIQGFHYQFNKTLLEILKAPDDAIITVEGIIEDIEVASGDMINAIQCKYHEANTAYTASAIYKPLLQMMHHFQFRSHGKVNYLLFAYFPGMTQTDFVVNKATLEAALTSQNKDFVSYVKELTGKIDLDAFLLKFSACLGPAYDALVRDACALLQASGITAVDVDTLAYPNAIHLIASLSIRHDASLRQTTRAQLLATLRQIKSTAISHWTLSLRNRKELLAARRKQLRPNLGKNARLRYFLLHADTLLEFESNVVMFIHDYLEKYHFKPTHLSTPVFCISGTEEQFQSIELRLHHKGITPNCGYIANIFDESVFLREPMTQKTDSGVVKREFHVRLLLWPKNGGVLNKRKGDDLFVIGEGGFPGLNVEDVNVEEIGSESFDEIKYMIGLADVYE